ncbi:MAG: MASE3 domain-containing protein [Thermodesulfobacteriota bacterium]
MSYEPIPSHAIHNYDLAKERRTQTLLMVGLCTALLLGLLAVSQYNYLLFHSVAELFSIAVAWSVFLLVWNVRPYMKNDALFFLGISYLFIGAFDLLHTLAYKGMGVLEFIDKPDLATQLWISGRGIEAGALLLFPLLLGKRIRSDILLGSLIAVAALLLAAIFSWDIFPSCFIEGSGLTPFKVTAEYTICLIVLIAIFLLYKKRNYLDIRVYYYMVASMSLTIAAELFFTFYTELYGVSNLIGHYFKILSFFFIYTSLIRSGLTRPYSLLFKELHEEKDALQEAKKLAEEASKTKSSFLAKMSHEIRTPMNSILGMLRLVLSGHLPGQQRERIQVAKDSAESLLWLLNDLLDLSKVEAGRFTLHEKEFRLRHLLNNVLKEAQPLAEEKGLKLHLAVDQDLPVRMIGDLHRLRRILFNLLSNAIKFTDQGRISLEAEQLELASCSDQENLLIITILFKIIDTGPGLDSDQLRAVFEPYMQGGRDSLSAEEGIGLGLAVCKEFSEQMGGRIWAASEPGEGSTFYVQLPLKTDGEVAEETDTCPQPETWADLPSQRILLVEDDKMNQIFITDLLASYGHRVVIAENGIQALEFLAKSSFDLVLMDIWLPEMDGIETTLRIRTADPRKIKPDIPVIGLSAHVATEKEMERFRNSGFNQYVVKPVSFEKLFAAMKEVLDHLGRGTK